MIENEWVSVHFHFPCGAGCKFVGNNDGGLIGLKNLKIGLTEKKEGNQSHMNNFERNTHLSSVSMYLPFPRKYKRNLHFKYYAFLYFTSDGFD